MEWVLQVVDEIDDAVGIVWFRLAGMRTWMGTVAVAVHAVATTPITLPMQRAAKFHSAG